MAIREAEADSKHYCISEQSEQVNCLGGHFAYKLKYSKAAVALVALDGCRLAGAGTTPGGCRSRLHRLSTREINAAYALPVFTRALSNNFEGILPDALWAKTVVGSLSTFSRQYKYNFRYLPVIGVG